VDACRIGKASRETSKNRRQLQGCRHAFSAWRDSDVMLNELTTAKNRPQTQEERALWGELGNRLAKERQRALKKINRNYKSLKVARTAARIKALVKKKAHGESVTDNLRRLLQHDWEKLNEAIDAFIGNAITAKLHNVRIKAKTLKYAIEVGQKLYPDDQLASASDWLTTIQDRVGAWHDELMLSQFALAAFAKAQASHEPIAIKIIRTIKKKEIATAESAREFIVSSRKTDEYRRLRRLLSASVYAMTKNGSEPEVENITGPLQ
jgi:CHAD domain-containing protein